MRKYYNKLVRDNIPDILDQMRVEYKCRYLTDEKEIIQYLTKKLLEEAREVRDAFYGEMDIVDELNDVALVLEELQDICFRDIDVDEAMDKAAMKDYEKGQFKKYIVLEYVEHED